MSDDAAAACLFIECDVEIVSALQTVISSTDLFVAFGRFMTARETFLLLLVPRDILPRCGISLSFHVRDVLRRTKEKGLTFMMSARYFVTHSLLICMNFAY